MVAHTAHLTHLDLLDELLFVQQNDLDVEGLDNCPATHLQASHNNQLVTVFMPVISTPVTSQCVITKWE